MLTIYETLVKLNILFISKLLFNFNDEKWLKKNEVDFTKGLAYLVAKLCSYRKRFVYVLNKSGAYLCVNVHGTNTTSSTVCPEYIIRRTNNTDYFIGVSLVSFLRYNIPNISKPLKSFNPYYKHQNNTAIGASNILLATIMDRDHSNGILQERLDHYSKLSKYVPTDVNVKISNMLKAGGSRRAFVCTDYYKDVAYRVKTPFKFPFWDHRNEYGGSGLNYQVEGLMRAHLVNQSFRDHVRVNNSLIYAIVRGLFVGPIFAEDFFLKVVNDLLARGTEGKKCLDEISELSLLDIPQTTVNIKIL